MRIRLRRFCVDYINLLYFNLNINAFSEFITLTTKSHEVCMLSYVLEIG